MTDLGSLVTLVIEQVNDGPVVGRQLIYRLQHRPVARLGGGDLQSDIQGLRPLPPGAFQQVLAGVGRHPQDVGPLVLRALKLPGLHQQLHEDRLADILGIVGVFQIGVTEAEDRVGVCVGQPLRLFHIVHVSQLLWSALT